LSSKSLNIGPALQVAPLTAEGKQDVGLLLLDEPRLHELVERDEVQLRERRVVEYAEMAVLRHQIVGSCGKGGQWVPVGIGIPSVKVDEITIGGTK